MGIRIDIIALILSFIVVGIVLEIALIIELLKGN